MNSVAYRHHNRRGATVVQWSVIAAVLVLGIVATLRTLGTNTNTHMNTTAGNVANPASLPARFGS